MDELWMKFWMNFILKIWCRKRSFVGSLMIEEESKPGKKRKEKKNTFFLYVKCSGAGFFWFVGRVLGLSGFCISLMPHISCNAHHLNVICVVLSLSLSLSLSLYVYGWLLSHTRM
jgi:hypothetical protein